MVTQLQQQRLDNIMYLAFQDAIKVNEDKEEYEVCSNLLDAKLELQAKIELLTE
ncbi:hypothetical protein [Pedobacter sp. L105]|uniref:hypothetical protein n=1 Tax=Pedobacter sp. L105 TaxID=1641871 RepID=UPI00131DB24E|nr:hypothetical protein [Pedobacter sp. L105]